MSWLGLPCASDLPAGGVRARRLLLVGAAGTLCALLPRLLADPAPVYPDSVLYLYTAMLGEAHSHMVFRYLSVLPIWVASWFSDDIYVVSRIHGCLMAVAGVAALCALCRVVALSLVETLMVCLLFAASPDAIARSGWAPLTDVTYGIAVVAAVASYLAWARGRLPSIVTGLVIAGLLGHRLSGGFVLIGLVLLRPWQARGMREALVLGATCAGGVLLYFVVSGWLVAGDPSWSFRSVLDLYDLGQVVQRRRDRTLNNVAGVLIDPRALGPLLLALWVSLRQDGRRFRPLLWCAAFVILGYDVFDAMSENLSVRARRFPPLAFLCFPMAAVYLRRHLGPAFALGACAAVFGVSVALAAGAEQIDVHWPYLLDATDWRPKTKWLLVLIGSAGLLGVAVGQPRILAIAVVVALALRSALDMQVLINFTQARAPAVAAVAEPKGTCPEAIVEPPVAFSEMLGHLNRLHNGPCTRMHVVHTAQEAMALPLKAPVVFSQFNRLPGYAPSRPLFREWRFRRFTRTDAAGSAAP